MTPGSRRKAVVGADLIHRGALLIERARAEGGPVSDRLLKKAAIILDREPTPEVTLVDLVVAHLDYEGMAGPSLARSLGFERDHRQALAALLADMEADGRIRVIKRGRSLLYALPEPAPKDEE